MVIEVQRHVLAGMLREYGEDRLAERAMALSDDELARIGTLGGYYAFGEDATALIGSMGGARALSLATIDVLEGSGRDLCRHHSPGEMAWKWSAEPDALERQRDTELRRHAAERQIPTDPNKRILDILDPPASDPASADASPKVRRCHELRTKPLKSFTDGDLRFMIEQQVGLNHLVGMALTRLRADPLLEGDGNPGDLLASVLRVDSAFWEPRYDPEVATRKLAETVRDRPEVAPEVRKLANAFVRDHPHRSVADVSD